MLSPEQIHHMNLIQTVYVYVDMNLIDSNRCIASEDKRIPLRGLYIDCALCRGNQTRVARESLEISTVNLENLDIFWNFG